MGSDALHQIPGMLQCILNNNRTTDKNSLELGGVYGMAKAAVVCVCCRLQFGWVAAVKHHLEALGVCSCLAACFSFAHHVIAIRSNAYYFVVFAYYLIVQLSSLYCGLCEFLVSMQHRTI